MTFKEDVNVTIETCIKCKELWELGLDKLDIAIDHEQGHTFKSVW